VKKPTSAANISSGIYEIFRPLCKLRVLYGFHNSSPDIPLPSQVNLILASYFLKTLSASVLPYIPEFSKWSLLFTFPHQNPVRISSPHLALPTPPNLLPLTGHPNNILWSMQIMKLLIMQFSAAHVSSNVSGQNISLNTQFSKPSTGILLVMRKNKLYPLQSNRQNCTFAYFNLYVLREADEERYWTES
jgi:hypothetical protein